LLVACSTQILYAPKTIHSDLMQCNLAKSREATVYYENYHYFREDDALERLSRLLMADAPTAIEEFRLVAVRAGIPQQEFHVLRGPVERAFSNDQENPASLTVR